MTWPADFVARLSRRSQRWDVLIRTIPTLFFPRAAYEAATHPRLLGGAVSEAIVCADVPEIGGEGLELPGCTATHGSCVIRFATENPGRIGVSCGSLVQVLLSVDGAPAGDAQPLYVGLADQLSTGAAGPSARSSDGSAVGAEYQLTLLGLGAVLGSRHAEGGTSALFSGMFDATDAEITADYTVGDTTLTVDTTAAWADWDGYGVYYIQITTAGGDEFVLRATGRTATSFTGVSTTGQVGTTAADALAGDVCRFVAAVEGHPVEVALAVILSTGTGTNGARDVLPETAGLGIPRELVDAAFSADVQTRTPSLSIVAWSLQEQANPGAWLEGFLAGAGFVITMRQGLIVVADVRDPRAATPDSAILERDIAEISAQWWDPEQGPQAASHVLVYEGGDAVAEWGTAGTINTVPSIERYTLDCPGISTSQATAATMLALIAARIAPHALVKRSAVEVLLPIPAWSVLWPGAVVALTAPQLRLPPDSSGSTRVEGRGALVTQVDLIDGAVRVGLIVLPPS